MVIIARIVLGGLITLGFTAGRSTFAATKLGAYKGFSHRNLTWHYHGNEIQKSDIFPITDFMSDAAYRSPITVDPRRLNLVEGMSLLGKNALLLRLLALAQSKKAHDDLPLRRFCLEWSMALAQGTDWTEAAVAESAPKTMRTFKMFLTRIAQGIGSEAWDESDRALSLAHLQSYGEAAAPNCALGLSTVTESAETPLHP